MPGHFGAHVLILLRLSMEEEPLQPAIARVIRIAPGPNDKPAKGFSWADYEDVETPGGTSPSSSRQPFVDGETSADADGDDDEGWVVKSRRRTSEFSSHPPPSFTSPLLTTPRPPPRIRTHPLFVLRPPRQPRALFRAGDDHQTPTPKHRASRGAKGG